MEIKRNLYLNKIINRKHNGLIKVITGIRRCGKSYLLFNLFYDHLIQSGIAENHIIKVAFDMRKNASLRTPDALCKFVESKMTDSATYYILLDEIQMLEEFVSVLNEFLHYKNADVYVTGSNSKFLSSDIVTEFRGRGDDIQIHPLSFAEYASVFSGTEETAWQEYYTYGGLPLILSMNSDEQKSEYLKGQFRKVYLTDIIERNKVRHESELEEFVNILSSAVGSLSNPLKLSRTFKSVKNVEISSVTLSKYAEYLENAFLINKAHRYDIKGKRYIGTPFKYYFEDVGLRNARLNFRQIEENHIMENIIYNELRIRGFNVDVGVVEARDKIADGEYAKKQFEVDFVANLGSRRYYIQSAFEMSTEKKLAQEKRPLTRIDDSFKKIIVVRENIKLKRDDNGFVIMGIREFLLNPNSLDL
jgi:predicted AAA+ superfamily ATPase